MQIATILPLALALITSAPCQGAPETPILVLRASDPAVVARSHAFLSRLPNAVEAEEEIDSCAPDHHLELSLAADGELSVTERAGSRTFELDIEVSRFVKTYEDEVQPIQVRVRSLLGETYGTIGLDYDDVAVIVDSIFAFPSQIHRVEITGSATSGAEQEGEPARTVITTSVLTKAHEGTWLHGLISDLAPSASGVRTLEPSGSSVELDLDLDLEPLMPHLSACLPPFAGLWSQSKEQRGQARDLMRRMLAVYVGTFSMRFDPVSAGVQMLAEVSDPADYTAIRSDPFYMEQALNMSQVGGQATVEFEPDAVEHRGVSLDRTTVEFANPMLANPVSDEHGKVRTAFGLAGRYLVSATGAEPDYTALIDAALDDESAPVRLKNGSLLEVRLRMAALVTAFARRLSPTATSPLPAAMLPDLVEVRMRAQGGGLLTEVTIQ